MTKVTSSSTTPNPASTPSTRDVATAWFEHISRGEIEQALALCHEDIEFINYEPVEGFNTQMSWIGTQHGRAETYKSFLKFTSVADVQLEELTNLVVERDTAVGFVHEISEIRDTGRRFEIDFVQTLTVRNGLITRWKSYTDPSPILRALAP
jgi:uncharacterized protein